MYVVNFCYKNNNCFIFKFYNFYIKLNVEKWVKIWGLLLVLFGSRVNF